MDKIIIRDLSLRTIIGTFPEERREKQDVIFNLELYTDLSRAGRSDALEDTVDYKSLKKQLIAMVEAAQFLLLERLAEAAAELCLTDARIRAVRITVDKPGALRFARSAAVEIFRRRRVCLVLFFPSVRLDAGAIRR